MEQLPLRPNVCMLLFNQEKKLFLGERVGEPGIWQFPQGGVEPGLSIEQNVLKELEEEVGIEPSKLRIIKRLKSTNDYDFQRVPPYARGVWRGQTQSFWVVSFLGTNDDIDLNKHEPEFTAWQWCTTEEVRLRAEPKRLPGYLGPIREFEEYLSSL